MWINIVDCCLIFLKPLIVWRLDFYVRSTSFSFPFPFLFPFLLYLLLQAAFPAGLSSSSQLPLWRTVLLSCRLTSSTEAYSSPDLSVVLKSLPLQLIVLLTFRPTSSSPVRPVFSQRLKQNDGTMKIAIRTISTVSCVTTVTSLKLFKLPIWAFLFCILLEDSAMDDGRQTFFKEIQDAIAQITFFSRHN